MTETLKYSVDQDGVALLVIDVPGRPMNVLTPGFQADLSECIDKVAGDPAIKGAVISSAKSSFMAGADIKDMVGAFDRGVTPLEASQFSHSLQKLFRHMETCGKPLAAAINGPSWAISIGRMPSGSRATSRRPQASSIVRFQAPSRRPEMLRSTSIRSGLPSPERAIPRMCISTSVSLSRTRWLSLPASTSSRRAA